MRRTYIIVMEYLLLNISCFMKGTDNDAGTIGRFTNVSFLETNPPETLEPVPHSFSVYALSRGKGVPEQAREVLVQSRTLLKAAQERGEVLRMVEQRIGIEGETRICAQFSNVEKALTMMDQIKKIGQGVDLVNVKAEPCPP